MKKILFFAISTIILSCNNKKNTDETDKEIPSSIISNNTNEEIERTKFYAENNNSTVSEENGISHNVEIKIKELKKEKMFESEKLKDSDGDLLWVCSYKVRYEFQLIDNGEIERTIQYNGYLLDMLEFNASQNKQRFDGYCTSSSAYIPELEGIKNIVATNLDEDNYIHISGNKNEIISRYTDNHCGRGEPINSQMVRFAIKAVKLSGILN